MNKFCCIPLAAIAAVSMVCLAALAADPKPPKPDPSSAALLEARTLKYQFRAGRYDVAERSIEVLEAAQRLDRDNTELLNELGTAYFMRLTSLAHGSKPTEDTAASAERARAAFARALELNPDDAYAVGGRGMARIILSKGGEAESRAGLDDLNRAVSLAPADVPVRLMRAFSTLARPSHLRNIDTIEEDLSFLMHVADGTKAADMLRVLLGDVYIEAGRRQDALKLYEHAAERSTMGGKLARSRLETIEAGEKVPANDMYRLRVNLGRECTMCHGPG